MPTPNTQLAVDARLGQRGLDELARGVDALLGAMVARQLLAHLGEDGMPEVRHSDRDVASCRSRRRPRHPRGDRGRPGRVAAHPGHPGRRLWSTRSATRPSRTRSPISEETVVRDKPVRRASSARLVIPATRSALSTRLRFRSRRDSSDPEPSSTHLDTTISCPLKVCQEIVRTRRSAVLVCSWRGITSPDWVGVGEVAHQPRSTGVRSVLGPVDVRTTGATPAACCCRLPGSDARHLLSPKPVGTATRP